ncbi:MAG: DNA mismatch repair protein MutS [Sandaracinaceae bacterium]|nr:DNA mismatch repair protein MutS [Sandaracinaceae bacterium]
MSDPDASPLAHHQAARLRFEAERERQDRIAARFSMAQLGLFGLSVVLAGSGLFGGLDAVLLGSGGAVFVIFLVVRAVQARVILRREQADVRREIHDRQVKRMTGQLSELPPPGAALPPGHPYAGDLDITGDQSLIARLDTTHTTAGARSLASWLAAPATLEIIAARQEAVRELAAATELRQELEAAVLETGRERLDARPFVELMEKKGLLEEKPWLKIVAPLMPLITIGVWAGGTFGPLSGWAWLLPVAVQILIVRSTEPRSREVYEAMGEKKGFVDAYTKLFRVVEDAKFDSEGLETLRSSLAIEGAPPSRQMKRLERWTSWYDLREQGIVHVFINPLLLWDLNCLIGIEAWIRTVGRKCGAWFDAIGDIEALAALSILLHQDPHATMPEVAEGGALEAEKIAHPLLLLPTRVTNDVILEGPGHCLIVTGSNMAGKSTLLRAVGVNVVLALAGGPVVARRMRVPRLRVRASMRIADSLQTGASYFQAELARLRLVVHRADADPPILFLLDELLRGTNAKARHIGARAVVSHLLERGGMGFVATHDVALSELEREREGLVRNVHFTDVIENGVMTFDYHLRPGVVRTSNALRLLAEVGIEVEDDPHLLDGVLPAPEAQTAVD